MALFDRKIIDNHKTYINNSSRSTQLTKLTCSSCQGQLELDMDNLISFCPYCGQKLLIDIDQLSLIMAEKEETKRKKIEVEKELELDARKRKDNIRALKISGVSLLVFLLIFICVSVYAYIGEKNEENKFNEIQNEVVVLIEDGNYELARLKANMIHAKSNWSSEHMEKWDAIREQDLKIIEEAIEKERNQS